MWCSVLNAGGKARGSGLELANLWERSVGSGGGFLGFCCEE